MSVNLGLSIKKKKHNETNCVSNNFATKSRFSLQFLRLPAFLNSPLLGRSDDLSNKVEQTFHNGLMGGVSREI